MVNFYRYGIHINKNCLGSLISPKNVKRSKNNKISQAPVADACNPSYSRDRDQEDRGLKPASSKWFLSPYLQNTQRKKAGGVAQAVEPGKCEALSSNPGITKKKKKNP
jgi:hypothetical protein